MKNYSFREFRRTDTIAYCGSPVLDGDDVIGTTVERAGVIVGWAGAMIGGDVAGLFMDCFDYNLRNKFLLHRGAINLLDELQSRGVKTVRVSCDTRFNRAREWIERLGFEDRGEFFERSL